MLLTLPGLGIADEAPAGNPAVGTQEDINVRDHGARGDGVAVDTTAFRKAIREAADASPVRRVVVPRGRYVLDADNIFGDLNGTHKIGLVVQGHGRESSVLLLRTGGKPKWFYNNGATPRVAFPTFADVRFETDNNALGGGFHITSAGHEQGFSFFRCRFHNLRTMLRLSGSAGNDSHRFFNCHIREAVRIGNNRRVNFTACTLSGEFLYTLAASATAAEVLPLNGWIDFRDCRVPPGLRDKITFATPFGRARALDCHEYAVKALSPRSKVSPDFDRKE